MPSGKSRSCAIFHLNLNNTIIRNISSFEKLGCSISVNNLTQYMPSSTCMPKSELFYSRTTAHQMSVFPHLPKYVSDHCLINSLPEMLRALRFLTFRSQTPHCQSGWSRQGKFHYLLHKKLDYLKCFKKNCFTCIYQMVQSLTNVPTSFLLKSHSDKLKEITFKRNWTILHVWQTKHGLKSLKTCAFEFEFHRKLYHFDQSNIR